MGEEKRSPRTWTAIVLTCQNKINAHIFQKELEIYQSKGFIERDVLILALEDPKARVGSGGATVNALLVVAEHLSAKAGFGTVTESVLDNANILILHMGRDFPFSPCGRLFNTLPAKHTELSKEHLCAGLATNFDYLLQLLTQTIAAGAPPGVWVCSTDMLLSVSPDTRIDWKHFANGITMVLFQGDLEYAKSHGVVKLGSEGEVKDITFKGTEEEIKACVLESGKVPLVSGLVYMNLKVAWRVISLHVLPPLDACTYYGLDNGADPIQLSLFFDILLCMAEDVTESDFVLGKRSGSYGRSTRMGTRESSESDKMLMRGARAMLWQLLRGVTLKGVVIKNGEFDYMLPSAECYRRQMLASVDYARLSGVSFDCNKHTHVLLHENGVFGDADLEPSAVVLNSIIEGGIKIGKESVVSNCRLQGSTTFGNGTILSGVEPFDLKALPEGAVLADDLCVLNFIVSLRTLKGNTQRILVILGVHDDLLLNYSLPNSTYLNKPWKMFFGETGISPEELWTGVPDQERSLWNAQLYSVERDGFLWVTSCGLTQSCSEERVQRWRTSPKFSLKEILSTVNLTEEFKWRKKLWFEIGRSEVMKTLTGCTNNCLVPFFKSCVKEGYDKEIMGILNRVVSSSESSPGVAARTLACIADVLGAMAGESAGLRSGPARNESWMEAFRLLNKGEIAAGVKALAEERLKWLDRPDLLIRAARHYEGAEQILRRHAVLTARQFFVTGECEPLPVGHWAVAEAPARADLSGGWSDTPPITYENGGTVLNVAIKLNGKKVTKAKVRKIKELEIVLVLYSGEHSVRVICSELADMANYWQPHGPGALLKACFCAVDIVTLPSDETLADQLGRKYQAGFELHTWSTAPHGSGLGTSSILAGVIIAALLRVTGRSATIDSLIHVVLLVEQMLTTGGGWQDNVGGLVPGFKISRSRASLPLRVDVERLELSKSTVDELMKRMVCFYSGRTRLAKNLLQNVIRNWYARFPQITQNAADLVSNAEEAAKALKEGNIEKFGECLSFYRRQKSLMAPGSEPKGIREMMEALEPLSYGQALAGAGGGGFIFVLTKEPNMVEEVKAKIQKMKPSEELAFYDVSVDWDGLTVGTEEP